MKELPFQIERFLVKQLACGRAPAAIAEDVQAQFLRTVEADQVRAYDPDADGSALHSDLRELYRRTRFDVLGEDEQAGKPARS